MVAKSGAPEVRVGIEGNPCRRGRHLRGGACGCHLTFWEGVGSYPSFRLVVYRGKPLAAASSSSRSFLEVLIGAGASESWSLVEDPGGRSDREASSFLLVRRCRHLFLLLFLCRFFWASNPSPNVCFQWYESISPTNPLARPSCHTPSPLKLWWPPFSGASSRQTLCRDSLL